MYERCWLGNAATFKTFLEIESNLKEIIQNLCYHLCRHLLFSCGKTCRAFTSYLFTLLSRRHKASSKLFSHVASSKFQVNTVILVDSHSSVFTTIPPYLKPIKMSSKIKSDESQKR